MYRKEIFIAEHYTFKMAERLYIKNSETFARRKEVKPSDGSQSSGKPPRNICFGLSFLS